MKTKYGLLTLAASLLLTALPSAQATLLVYEGFNYAPAPLNGQNGGTGWTGAWGNASSSGTQIVGSGLTYTGLETSGNATQWNVNTGSASRAFDGSSSGVSGTTTWFSLLFLPADNLTSSDYRALFFNTAAASSTRGIGVEFRNGQIATRMMGTEGSFGGSFSVNATNLVVGSFTFNGFSTNSTLSLWLNPTNFSSLGTPTVTGTRLLNNVDMNFSSTSSLYLRSQNGGPSVITYDEIRIGTTAASVLPVPEPSAVFLLGAAGLLLCLRRFRSSASTPSPGVISHSSRCRRSALS